MAKYSEIEIIAGLKQGNAQIFEYLFDEYFARLQFFAERLTSNKEESKDIVINSFTKLWKIKENFESVPNILAFLYLTTKRNCLDYLRFLKRDKDNKLQYGIQNTLSSQADTEHLIIKADLLHRIYTSINKLPPKCREVFKLTYFEGFKADEIARMLQISVSNVTSQRQRALERLRKVLSNREMILLVILLNAMHAEPLNLVAV
jgi:RNA polymerase sigma-70 factor (family 1)